MKKWYEKPMVISAVQHYVDDSFDVLRNYVLKSNYNIEQLLHTHASGFSAVYNEEEHGEKLTKYLKEAKEAGLYEIVYYNCHFFNKEQLEKNPECALRNKDGSISPAYTTGAFVCVNKPYMEKAKIDLENLAKHDLDGIFLDGPLAIGKCYCEHCLKEFEEMYGKSMDGATDKEVMKYNIFKVTRFVKMCSEIVKSVKPDAIIYLNNSALCSDVTGSNTREVAPYVDFIGAEGGFVWVDKTTTNWHASPMAKLIETQAEGKPTVIFIAGDYKPWSYCMHTPEETTLYYAQSLANGANVWYGLHGEVDAINTAGGKAAVKLNKFILDNEEIFSNHKPHSRVALMWSQNTANYYKSSISVSDFRQTIENEEEGSKFFSDHYKSFYGAYEMLSRCHIQHDVIDEVAVLKGELSKYDLLIMPTCACVSDKEAEKIREFVKNGGNLITTYDTGFYDENGEPVKEPKLADLQGIVNFEGFVDYSNFGTGYLQSRDETLFKGVSEKSIQSTLISVKAELRGKVHGEYCEPMESRYDFYPTKWYPAIVENSFGKGKAIYFTGTIGEFYNYYSNPDCKVIFENAVKYLANPIVTTDAPGSVEMVLRKLENGYAFHCINFTGEMERPLNRIIKLNDVKIKIALDDVKGEIKSLRGAKFSDVKVSDKFVEFTVSDMDEYEIFTIK